MTPSDEIAERDIEAADNYFIETQYSSQTITGSFIAGIKYAKSTYGTFDQAIELLRSATDELGDPNRVPNFVLYTQNEWADWLSNNKPRGV